MSFLSTWQHFHPIATSLVFIAFVHVAPLPATLSTSLSSIRRNYYVKLKHDSPVSEKKNVWKSKSKSKSLLYFHQNISYLLIFFQKYQFNFYFFKIFIYLFFDVKSHQMNDGTHRHGIIFFCPAPSISTF